MPSQVNQKITHNSALEKILDTLDFFQPPSFEGSMNYSLNVSAMKWLIYRVQDDNRVWRLL